MALSIWRSRYGVVDTESSAKPVVADLGSIRALKKPHGVQLDWTMRLIRCSLIEKLLLLWLFLLQAAVVASTKLLGELVDPSGRVNKLQFAGVERVTVIANIDPQLGLYATSLKRIAATTSYGCVLVIRVDSLFHRSFLMYLGCVQLA